MFIGSFTKLNGQSVTGTTFTVCPLITYTYVFNAPSGWTNVVVTWDSGNWFLGSGGLATPYNIGDPSDGGIENGLVEVMWGETFAPLQFSLVGTVTYKYVSNGSTLSGSYPISEQIILKGIPSTVAFNNPKVSIQKCCTEKLTVIK